MKPTHLFVEALDNGDNQRPDILLRNPRGFGGQVILDVAVTGVDGQSSSSDDCQLLQARFACCSCCFFSYWSDS